MGQVCYTAQNSVAAFVAEAITAISNNVPALGSQEWRFALIAAAHLYGSAAQGERRAIVQYVNGRMPELNAHLNVNGSKARQSVQVHRITELIMSTNVDTYSIPFEAQISILDVAKTIIRCGDLWTRCDDDSVNEYAVPQFELLSKVSRKMQMH